MPRLQRDSDHEIVHFAVSGLIHVLPFENQGIKVYGQTKQGGNLGVGDLPVVRQLEDIDLVHLNYDAWATSQAVSNYSFNYTLYPPIDHSPLPPNWQDVMEKAIEIVPYCKFGERVMKEAGIDEDKIHEPIYHGVDTDVYKPQEVSKEKAFGVDEDSFVIMLLKNNQGTRCAFERQLRGFSMFLDQEGVDRDNTYLFLYSNIQGENSFNLAYLMQLFDISDNVLMIDQRQQRFGLQDRALSNFYSVADVFLNCTRGEGFGLPIVEAMSSGKPAICTGYSSMPELLSGEEGEIRKQDVDEEFVMTDRGILVPTSDIMMTLGKHSFRREVYTDGMVAALRYAYENREEMAKKGKDARKWVIDENLDWSHIASEWADFFDEYEEKHFEEDEMGISWEEVSDARGGVGGFGK